MRVTWSDRAIMNLGEVHAFLLEHDAERTAAETVRRVLRTISLLEYNPELGIKIGDRRRYKLVVPETYVIVRYRVLRHHVEIGSLFDGRRAIASKTTRRK